MGRSKKYALDDFKVDVKFFESDNEDMLLLRQKYGYIADVIYFKITAMIFNQGYYYKFDNVEKLCAIVAKPYGNQFAKIQKIENVIRDTVNAGLFDSRLYLQNVLTSEKIQRYYLKSVERRLISINDKYWLLDKKVNIGCRSNNIINVDINNINDNINQINANSKNTTNTSIVSKDKTKIYNKLINNAGAHVQNNTQNNARNIISDDFDITPDELAILKEKFIGLIKLSYPGTEWIVDTVINNKIYKQYYELVIDALLKASRLRHKITLSGVSYNAEYFKDIITTINLDNLAKICEVVSNRAEDVQNMDFFILGTLVKIFDNMS